MSRIVLDLIERVGPLAAGSTAEVPFGPGDADVITAWCERTGNQAVSMRGGVAVVRRGREPGPVALPPRLWLYTNFDCNLACDYCCSRSSPKAPRRALGRDRVERIAAEAAALEVTELFLTGGEPFLLPDLDEIAGACAARLPTTLLTNGMLLRGRRLDLLRRMPRDGLALQISLDSPTPERHDRHRGTGTWERAVHGIRTASAEGFRVRVAATVAAGESDAAETERLHVFLDELGIPAADRVIRPVAQQGFAEDGVTVTPASVIPEMTITADGVYWHPVGVDDPDQFVTREIFPLADALAEVRSRHAEYRHAADAAAQRFPCA